MRNGRIGVQVNLDVGYVAEVVADLVDYPTNPIARPAPPGAEMHNGRSGAGKPQVCAIRVGALVRLRINFADIA